MEAVKSIFLACHLGFTCEGCKKMVAEVMRLRHPIRRGNWYMSRAEQLPIKFKCLDHQLLLIFYRVYVRRPLLCEERQSFVVDEGNAGGRDRGEKPRAGISVP
jgi:hypothetical protein